MRGSKTCLALPLSLAIAAASAGLAEEPGEWPMAAKGFAGWRYSPLHQIDTANVGQLRVAWTFSLGVLRGQEAAPIVAGTPCSWSAPTRTSSMPST